MPAFKFVGNAEAIYEKSISATPRLFRGYTRDGLDKILMERFGEKKRITEADLVAVIKENTPSAFLARGMEAIAPLLKDKSLAEL
jgi:hypothetical protein